MGLEPDTVWNTRFYAAKCQQFPLAIKWELGSKEEVAVWVLQARKKAQYKSHFFTVCLCFHGGGILKRAIATGVMRPLEDRMNTKMLQCKVGFEWI